MTTNLDEKKRAQQDRTARRAWAISAHLISIYWGIALAVAAIIFALFHRDYWWVLGLVVGAAAIVAWIKFDPPPARRRAPKSEGRRIVDNWRQIAVQAGMVGNMSAISAQIAGYRRATAWEVFTRKAKLREALDWLDTEYDSAIGGHRQLVVVPVIVEWHEDQYRVVLYLEPLPGEDVTTMARRAAALALAARVDTVRVLPADGGRRGLVKVVLSHRDPLAVPHVEPEEGPERNTPAPPSASPFARPQAPEIVRKPPTINIGATDADAGIPWNVDLGQHQLIGGVTGSGKSVVLNAMLAKVEPLEHVQNVLIDLKGMVEFAPHAPRAYRTAGDHATAADVLEEVCDLMDKRLAAMRDAGTRFWGDMAHGFDSDHPLVAIWVDEVAELYVKPPGEIKASRELALRIETAMSRLARLSRAAGLVLILATQKPTTDAVPSHTRDNVPGRICGRVTTNEQGRAILGSVDPESIEAATKITHAQKGYFVVPTATGWVMAKARFLNDERVAQIVTATAHLRKDSIE